MMAQIKAGGDDAEAMVAVQAIGALMAVLMDGAPEEDGGDPPEKSSAS